MTITSKLQRRRDRRQGAAHGGEKRLHNPVFVRFWVSGGVAQRPRSALRQLYIRRGEQRQQRGGAVV